MRYYLIDFGTWQISMTDNEADAMNALHIADTVVIDSDLCDRVTIGDRDPIPTMYAISTGEP